MRLLAARAAHRAAALLAQPRGGDLHLLPAGGLLPDLRRGLRRQRDQEARRIRGAAFLEAGMIGYGVAATCFAGLGDHAGRPARVGRPQARSARRRSRPRRYLLGVLGLDVRRLPDRGGADHRARPAALLGRRPGAGCSRCSSSCCIGAACVRGDGPRDHGARPLRRGLVRGDQRDLPADGDHLGHLLLAERATRSFLRVIAEILPLTHYTELTRDVMVRNEHIWSNAGASRVVVASGARSGSSARCAASAGSRRRVSDGADAGRPEVTLDEETAMAFVVSEHEQPAIEIRVNFGILAGREATPAEIDHLAGRAARRGRDRDDRGRGAPRDRRQDAEASVHLVRIELSADQAPADPHRAGAPRGAPCRARRPLGSGLRRRSAARDRHHAAVWRTDSRQRGSPPARSSSTHFRC